MDTNVEDKMLDQIQMSLSNSIDENLFTTGRTYEVGKAKNLSMTLSARDYKDKGGHETAVEDVVATYPSTNLSRAEYIRQAREACLKQLGSVPDSTRSAEYVLEERNPNLPAPSVKRKNKLMQLFPEVSEEDTEKEAASFNSLIIRTVCCVVIFLSIFAIDKLKVSWGDFTHLTVREFITSNDKLAVLEDYIVSWLK